MIPVRVPTTGQKVTGFIPECWPGSFRNRARLAPESTAVRNHIHFRADWGELVTEMPAFVPDLINFVYVWYARWSWRLMPDPELTRLSHQTVE